MVFYEYDDVWHWTSCVDCGEEMKSTHWSFDCLSNICIECGAEFENTSPNHEWPETYEYDENGHWFTCGQCGKEVEPEAHWYYCQDPDTCMTCGYVNPDNPKVSHYWMDSWLSKDEYHYKQCKDCGAEYSIFSHTVSCKDPGVCTACGATGITVDEISHADVRYQHDAAEHWGVCNLCGETVEKGKHWTDCSKPNDCSTCGATGVIIDEMGHFAVDWSNYMTNDEYHWYECDCGEDAFKAEHTEYCYDPGYCYSCGMVGDFAAEHPVLNAGWETDDAHHWKTCAACAEAVNKAEHADEDADGKCDLCGVSVAHTHTWGDPVTVAATCTTDGSKTTACTACDEKTVETIAATGHIWGEAVTVEATCTTDGSKTTACTKCDEKTVEVIEATDDHSWETVVNEAATCTKQGRTEKTCTVCDETSMRTYAAKGHAYGLVFITEGNGTHAKTCADCGDKHIETCTLTSTEMGSMVCSACATCGYAVYTMSDSALETVEGLADAEAEIKVKRVENVSFEMVAAPAEEGVEAETEPMDVSDVVLVVHETELEMTVELPDTVTASVKKVLAVSLLKEGASIQPSGKVKLRIPVVEEEIAGLKLMLMNENGELIEIEYEIIDGVIVFETEAVGVFLFVEPEE